MKKIFKFALICISSLIIVALLSMSSMVNLSLSKINVPSKGALEITGWDWYTRTTTNDIAYNGKHVQIINDDIYFYGYGVISYKDFLFKNSDILSDKTITFRINELVTDWHTLEGGGFLLNSSIENNLLSGYCLLYEKESISLYKINSVNVNTFSTAQSTTIAKNYGTLLKTVTKNTASSTHDLVLNISSSNVTVSDNNAEIINYNFETPYTVGGYGPLVSYTQHNCSSLSKIAFENLNIVEYIPVTITNICSDNNDKISGTTFEIYDENNNLVATKQTDSNGNLNISVKPGTYTYYETNISDKYIINTNKYQFTVSEDNGVNKIDGAVQVENKLATTENNSENTNTTSNESSAENSAGNTASNKTSNGTSKKDNTVATSVLPNTGIKNLIVLLIVTSGISAFVFKVKSKNNF